MVTQGDPPNTLFKTFYMDFEIIMALQGFLGLSFI